MLSFNRQRRSSAVTPDDQTGRRTFVHAPRRALGGVVAVLALAAVTPASSYAGGAATHEPHPGLAATHHYGLKDLAVAKSSTGPVAIVDRSMLGQGITSAANPYFVDLSWDAYSKAGRYVVSRDGKPLSTPAAGVSNFRDTSVVGGRTYRYNVIPLLPADAKRKARMWSMKVRVPSAPAAGEHLSRSLQRQAASEAHAMSAATTTTVSWETFIPQSRIDAPPAGCDYGRGYAFGGDGHGYDWTASSFRTAVHAVINWNSKSVDGYVAIGTTHVYRKSDGRLVAQRTASGAKSYAKKMGSGSDYVDVRLVTHAGNPFCHLSAIDGAFSMHLTQGGNYSIFSGNHRQMPNHYVYIYNGGRVTDVYKARRCWPAVPGRRHVL
jgi:hypothetical protein